MQCNKIEESVDFRPANQQLWPKLRSFIDQHSSFYRRLITFDKLANLSFLLLLLTSSLSLFHSLIPPAEPSLAAFSLSSALLLASSWYVFNRYMAIFKEYKSSQVVERFIKQCCSTIHYQDFVPEHKITIAGALGYFADQLMQTPFSSLTKRSLIVATTSLLHSFWCRVRNGEILLLHEKLLKKAHLEYLSLIHNEPLNLTYHSHLANSCVLLANHHSNAACSVSWFSLFKSEKQQICLEKQRHFVQKAIEEFTIICQFAPNDPWTYTQLAESYRQLKLPHKEIEACEHLLKLCPNDIEFIWRLGKLFFLTGQNAKGLQQYQQLLELDSAKAVLLIREYDNPM